MNLIYDQWIPVRLADGTTCRIAPCEIGSSDNPVVDIIAPRPDFRGALYQFLIGLLQTAYAPEDNDEWLEKWENIPARDDLKNAFTKFADAFELINDNGPAFMQDYAIPQTAKAENIKSLLIDSPGENTIKENRDLFVKRDSVSGICNNCSAMALLTLQINAPSGGKGNRTGIRGGGPLTTLVIPEISEKSIWYVLWANILTTNERFGENPGKPTAEIFPWLGTTRESSNSKETYPEDVNELQLYWATPRRIRIENKTVYGTCDICGAKEALFTSYLAKNLGVKYSSTWRHTLSPYRIQNEKNGTTCLIAIKGKQGGVAYTDWLGLTFNIDNNERPSDNLNSVVGDKIFLTKDFGQSRIWCFGYDMDKMKARCWYDQKMPLIMLNKNKIPVFIELVQKLINASTDITNILKTKIKQAWFKTSKDDKYDFSFVKNVFIEETETEFFSIIEKLRYCIENDQDTTHVLLEWRKIIIETAERLFDHFALQNTDELKNMKRIAEAAKTLTNELNSPKRATLQALKEGS